MNDVYVMRGVVATQDPLIMGKTAYKIGYSSAPERRVKEVARSYAVKDVELIATRNGGVIAEQMLQFAFHSRWEYYSGLGFEWYILTDDECDLLINLMEAPLTVLFNVVEGVKLILDSME